MPRKAKEKSEELNNIEKFETVKETKKTRQKKPAKSKEAKVVEETVSIVNEENIVKSTTNTKSTSKSKSATKTSKSRAKTKSTNTAITNTKTKSAVKSKKSNTVKASPVIVTEYYDLPFRYNQTVVKILAQTPTTLFIYWDISDEDRNSYIQKYGENFFENTRPYLIITNKTMNYTFEVAINDFANSWYLHIHDADCEYKVELGRKFIVDSQNSVSMEANTSSQENTSQFESYKVNDYLYITSSNMLETPNDHILFDKLGSSVFFRNTKTNITEEKNISSISFLQKIGKVYNIYDLYKEIYQDELISDEFGLNLPSSSSSTFK